VNLGGNARCAYIIAGESWLFSVPGVGMDDDDVV